MESLHEVLRVSRSCSAWRRWARRPGRIVGVTAALGLTVLGFAVPGNPLLVGASPAVLAGTLSFSAAALLYLVTEELLMEAHEVEEKPIATLVLFGGFLVFWAIQLMGHRPHQRGGQAVVAAELLPDGCHIRRREREELLSIELTQARRQGLPADEAQGEGGHGVGQRQVGGQCTAIAAAKAVG
jgi:hypothetical protein